MKTMTVFEARNNFSRTLEVAKRDVVVITRNGKPVAAIQAIRDDDLEDLVPERSPKFWNMIRRARPTGAARRRPAAARPARAHASRCQPRIKLEVSDPTSSS
jgi:prevent-host-death family protein